MSFQSLSQWIELGAVCVPSSSFGTIFAHDFSHRGNVLLVSAEYICFERDWRLNWEAMSWPVQWPLNSQTGFIYLTHCTWNVVYLMNSLERCVLAHKAVGDHQWHRAVCVSISFVETNSYTYAVALGGNTLESCLSFAHKSMYIDRTRVAIRQCSHKQLKWYFTVFVGCIKLLWKTILITETRWL